MATTVAASNLRALHSQSAVRMPRHRARQRIKVRRPPAPALELVIRRVQRGTAASAVVHALVRVMLVVLAASWGLGALVTQDVELLWNGNLAWTLAGGWQNARQTHPCSAPPATRRRSS